MWSNIIQTLGDKPIAGYATSAYAVLAGVVGKSADLNTTLTTVSLIVGIIAGVLTSIVMIRKLWRGDR